MPERPATDEEVREQQRRNDQFWPGFVRTAVILSALLGLFLTGAGLATAVKHPGQRLGGLACLLIGLVPLTIAAATCHAWLTGGKGWCDRAGPPYPGRVLSLALRRERMYPGCVLVLSVIALALLGGGVLFVIALLSDGPAEPVPGRLAKFPEDPPDVHANWAVAVLAILFGGFIGAAWLFALVYQFPILLGVREPRLEVSAHPFRPGQRHELYLRQGGPLRVRTLRVRLVCTAPQTVVRTYDTDEREMETRYETLVDQELIAADELLISLGSPYTVCVPFVVPDIDVPRRGPVNWRLSVEMTFALVPLYSFDYPVEVLPGRLASAIQVAPDQPREQGQDAITGQRGGPGF
jgi:hypothetical protein